MQPKQSQFSGYDNNNAKYFHQQHQRHHHGPFGLQPPMKILTIILLLTAQEVDACLQKIFFLHSSNFPSFIIKLTTLTASYNTIPLLLLLNMENLVVGRVKAQSQLSLLHYHHIITRTVSLLKGNTHD